mmetsp:Transcript_32830/g.57361  ORF Transcript_32830/g.57361 Transcript_32830/m.57361 type:complete len:684 (+) Transcript_32830:82-2133(+)
MDIKHSDFINNTSIEGGAVYWKEVQPKLSGLTFSNNSATSGKDITSCPFSIELFGSDLQPLSGSSRVEVSSQAFMDPVLIGVCDAYGHLINKTFDEQMRITVDKGTLIGTAFKIPEQGVFNFTSIRVISDPGSAVSLSGTWETKESSQSLKFNLTIMLRECIVGEYVSGLSCVVCSPGTYSLQKGVARCSYCPDHAECSGGSRIVVDDDYWKLNEFSDDIYKCLIEEICLGGEIVTCDEGYSGRLCTECEDNYERLGRYNCKECLPRTFLYLKVIMATITIWVVSNVVLYYFFTKTSVSLHYVRCWLSYVQTVSFFTPFTIAWPEPVLNIYEAYNVIGTFAIDSISSDCILDEFGLKPVYVKIAVFSMFPFGIGFMSCCFWLVIALKTRSFEGYFRRVIALTLTWTLLICPYILQSAIWIYSCRPMEDDVEWLISDYSIECGTLEHSMLKYGLALPSVIIWCFIAPVSMTAWMMKAKKSNGMILSYFKGGYRSRYKLWEIANLFKKYWLIVPCTFLAKFSSNAQIVSGLVALHLYLTALMYLKPCKSAILNVLEYFSALCAFSSLAAGHLYALGIADNSAVAYFMLVLLHGFNFFYLIAFISLLIHSCRSKAPNSLNRKATYILNNASTLGHKSSILKSNISSAYTSKTSALDKTSRTVIEDENATVPKNPPSSKVVTPLHAD